MYPPDATPDATTDPALFPIENPNPVFRVAPDGLILFANRASEGLLASWGIAAGERLPIEWQQHVAEALASGAAIRLPAPCDDLVFELDLVPIAARNYVNVYGRDVTEQEAVRREREALLAELQRERVREAEQRRRAEARAAELEATLDAIDDGVVLYDQEGRFSRQNPAALRILGYSHGDGHLSIEERRVRLAAALVDDPAATVEQMPVARACRGESVRGALMRIHPDGDLGSLPTYVSVSATPIRDPDGAQIGVVSSFSDVTALLQAQVELEQRVAELQTLLDLLPAGIAISYDPNARDIRVNRALARMLAAPPDANVLFSADASERGVQYRAFDQAGRELPAEELPIQAAAGRGAEVRDMLIDILRADGVRLTLLSYAVPLYAADGRRRGAVGAYIDITALRAAEIERERLLAALQERQRELEQLNAEMRALNASLEQRVAERTAELEAIFASLPDAIYIGDENGIYRCNALALNNLGCESIEELWDKIPALAEKVQTRDAATGERLSPEREPFTRALQGEAVTAEMILRNLKTGQDMIVRSACAPIRSQGRVRAAVALNTDITERKRMEVALQESEERYRLLFEKSADGILLTTPDGAIQFANPAACRLLGRSESEIRAGGRRGLVDPGDARWATAVAERGRTGRFAGELSFQRGDGSTFPGDVTSNVFRDREGQPRTITIMRDITERKRMEEELLTSREHLKQLTHHLVELQERERSYVANELYNDEGQRLFALLLELGQIEKQTGGDPQLCERIRRAKQLADSILADMHSLAVSLRPASLDRLGLLAGLRHYAEQLGQQHALAIQVAAGGPQSLALPPDTETMLYRIAQEAVLNAVIHGRAQRIDMAVLEHEGHLTLIVEDDGQGFDVAAAARGGALGILGMRERAEMLGGTATIESRPGKGTTVYIEVPVSLS
jgi:PAS domain S-box-containing protein